MANDLFGQGVATVLRTWEALDIAVQNGFGGTSSVEKARWMEAATAQYFRDNGTCTLYNSNKFNVM